MRTSWKTGCAALAVAVVAALPGVAAGEAAAATFAVTSAEATAVTQTQATLRATVLASGLARVGFELWSEQGYALTKVREVKGGLLPVEVAITVKGLTPDTTYTARPYLVVGEALAARGLPLSFRTLGAAVPEPVGELVDDGLPGAPAADEGAAPLASPPAAATAPAPTAPAATTPAGTAADPGLPLTPATAHDRPEPELHETVVVAPVSGTVRVRGEVGDYHPLTGDAVLPTGALIDARRGSIELTTALDAAGQTQTARFWGGVFQVRQPRAAGGRTDIVLRGGDFSGCPRTGRPLAARAAARRRPPRRLWGSDRHGRFQTRGRGSVATVRGTRWLTEDRCEGTLTRVAEGAVSVRDLGTGRSHLLRAGQSYLARVRR